MHRAHHSFANGDGSPTYWKFFAVSVHRTRVATAVSTATDHVRRRSAVLRHPVHWHLLARENAFAHGKIEEQWNSLQVQREISPSI